MYGVNEDEEIHRRREDAFNSAVGYAGSSRWPATVIRVSGRSATNARVGCAELTHATAIHFGEANLQLHLSNVPNRRLKHVHSLEPCGLYDILNLLDRARVANAARDNNGAVRLVQANVVVRKEHAHLRVNQRKIGANENIED